MTAVLTVAVIVFGVLAYTRLPVNDLPVVDYPVISVQANLSGRQSGYHGQQYRHASRAPVHAD